MAGQRNTSIELLNYLKSLNIEVNIGKNKARGNKGIFMTSDGYYRIDVSKNISEHKQLAVIVHEFSHYIHYKKDKNLNSLNFVFKNYNSDIENELINVTVQEIPKEFATKLFNQKDMMQTQIHNYAEVLKNEYPNFKLTNSCMEIEKSLNSTAKYLLKYDRVKIFNNIYSVDTLEQDFPELNKVQIAYIKLKSCRRAIKRINSRIARLNRYYNRPSELFARFAEMFFTNKNLAQQLAPLSSKYFQEVIEQNQIPELTTLASFF